MDKNTASLRKIVKVRILSNDTFRGKNNERLNVLNLLKTTIEFGESNSALLIGPRGSGKTTLVKSVLKELEPYFKSDAVLVKLHGLVHTDDRLALKSITTQLKLANVVGNKVFGSFADNLAFLLACLKSGDRTESKSVIFIIEEFDLFCSHHNQTLLYNLFDISQSAQTPICVLGITCRLDVIELLEKRVKSRFSHRQYFMFSGKEQDTTESRLKDRIERFKDLLTIQEDQIFDLSSNFIKKWNSSIINLSEDVNFRRWLSKMLDIDTSERTFNNILLQIISKLDNKTDVLTPELFMEQMKLLEKDDVIQVLHDLSISELILLIAMKHHIEIYDNQPMNFEMILTRYNKFSNAHPSIDFLPRKVIMKYFQTIEKLGLISMLPSRHYNEALKEFQLFKLLVLPEQIMEALKTVPGLPTAVVQWANSSLA